MSTTWRIAETNIRALIDAHRDGLPYREHYACGWLTSDQPDRPSQRLVTIGRDHPDATIVVYGDGTIGIEIGGRIWAAQMPHDLRGPGPQHQLPWQDWQWLNWASGHQYIDDTGEWTNCGDTHDLQLITP